MLPLTTTTPDNNTPEVSHHKANVASRIEPKKVASLGTLIKDKLADSNQDKGE